MPLSKAKDNQSKPIEEGDQVRTKMRGGKHEGGAEKNVSAEKQAEKEDIKNPPKVLFTKQDGHEVAHITGMLENEDE